jgi:hypothetical protein
MKQFRLWLSVLPLFFPLYLVRFDVIGIPTTLLEVLVGMTAVWGVIAFVRPKQVIKWLNDQREEWKDRAFWPVLLFLIAAIVSLFVASPETIDINGEIVQSGRLAFGIWKGWIVMPLVYFGMLYVVKRDDDFVSRSNLALILSGVGLSVWAVYQMVTGDFYTIDGRASGPFNSANYLALYLAPVLLAGVLSVVRFIEEQEWQRVGVFSAMVLFMGFALWGTQSYAAFIAFAAGLGFYVWVSPKTPKQVKWGSFGLALFVAGILMVSQSGTQKFQEFLDFEERTSSSVRIEVYEIASDLIQQHPLLGIGLGQFELQYPLNAPEVLGHAPYEWVMIHPHNLILALWLNTGLLGLVSMSWLVGFVFVKHFRHESSWVPGFVQRLWKKITQKPSTQVQLMWLSMLVVILVHGLFDTPFFKNDLAYLWWLVLGLLV